MVNQRDGQKKSREIEITEELLRDYRSMKDELEETKYRLHHLNDNDAMIGNDVIFDYSTGQPIPQSVVGYDYAKHNRMQTMYENRIKRITEQMEAVEEYIDGLPSSMSRRVMSMYFIQGKPQKQIAGIAHKSQAKVSSIIATELSKLG